MLEHFEVLLRTFPFSPLSPGISALKVYAIELIEPPLVEHYFAEPAQAGAAIEMARAFQNSDCLYQINGGWDLWQFEAGWKLAPSPVSLLCFGPLFQNEVGDHLRVELGVDWHFLPQPGIRRSATMIQSNIRGLLRLVHECDVSLAVEKRMLWSESGENFADRLQAALS